MSRMSEIHAELELVRGLGATAERWMEARETAQSAFLDLIENAVGFGYDSDVDDRDGVYSHVHILVDAHALKAFMTEIGLVTGRDEHPYEALNRLLEARP